MATDLKTGYLLGVKTKKIDLELSPEIKGLTDISNKYIGDSPEDHDMYVYKLCCDVSTDDQTDKWLVIMKKLPDTKTNEARNGIVDEKYAKFRANKLMVIHIIDMNNPDLSEINPKKYVVNEFMYWNDGFGRVIDKKMRYDVGQIVEPDCYDEHIDAVCTNGIHYYKSIVAAFYQKSIPEKYTGTVLKWHSNGSFYDRFTYVNGNLM